MKRTLEAFKFMCERCFTIQRLKTSTETVVNYCTGCKNNKTFNMIKEVADDTRNEV